MRVRLLLFLIATHLWCQRLRDGVDGIEDYLALCPFSSVCLEPNITYTPDNTTAENNGTTASYNIGHLHYPHDQYNYRGYTDECCQTMNCTCPFDCQMSCCPGPIDELISDSVLKSKRTLHCAKRAYKYQYKRTRLYSACPREYTANQTISDRCFRDVDGFDFASEPVAFFMPVTDLSSSKSYKNRYCAICSDANMATLVQWSMRADCLAKGFIDIWHFKDIPDMFAERPNCHIDFSPPELLDIHVEECTDFIDRCNQTGLWQVYDVLLERACLSYTSDYDTGAHPKYGNVHCYLCNTNIALTDVAFSCFTSRHKDDSLPVFPYTQLLDFMAETQTSSDTGLTCEANMAADYLQNECLPLVCADGMTFHMSQTKSCRHPTVENSKTPVCFHLNYRLERLPHETDILAERMEMFLELLSDEARYKVKTFSEYNAQICSMAMIAILHDGLEKTITSMSEDRDLNIWNYIDYIEYRVRITFKYYDDDEAVSIISGLAENFANYSSNMTLLTKLFKVSYHTIPTGELFASGSHPWSYTMYSKILNLDLPKFFHIVLTELCYQDDFLNRGVLDIFSAYQPDYCREEAIQIEIWPTPFQPRVEVLNTNELFDQFQSLDPVVLNFAKNGWFVPYQMYESIMTPLKTVDQSLKTLGIQAQQYTVFVWLSLVCVVVSLSASFLTFSVYVALPRLRNLPGLNTMALVLSLFLSQLFYLISHSSYIDKTAWYYTFAAVTLHFTLLAYIFWTFICTFHVARLFRSSSRVTSGSYVAKDYIRYNISVILLSACFVTINIGIGVTESHGLGIGYGGDTGYISSRHGVLFTLALPISAVTVTNLCMFAFTTITFCRMPNISATSQHNLMKLRVLAKLATITGATWVFQFLYEYTAISAFGYCFIVFNGGQGVFLCISFVLTKRVWAMIKERTSGSSMTSGTSSFTKNVETKAELEIRTTHVE